ncbi:serine hydroxymethyltransferase [Helicoverpa zea nudivirus 2]|uniref:Serine hydroxymethyltransferase n=1 Tax=Helicoverpa zea nudivirus 2 TaxID=1128424 RepID=G9I092_HZNV2|nr:orf66 gene product [Helicoverpa zea nudivirus 2]AEW69615.1 serine hydroxymethyltransferase [Helicoverpa zea nudivirus 2]
MNLYETDPELYALVEQEADRQRAGLELIASENFTTLPVRECMSSCLINKYSEGRPGKRYYGGNEFIDRIELLAQQRCLRAFNLNESEWGVCVQPYSGSMANFAVYTGIVKPHGRIMGLDLPDGGHLTHGFRNVSATSLFFESMPYKVDPQTGLVDYAKLAESANLFKPRLIIAGTSCYPRRLDYRRFREIADAAGSLLMADIAHIAGLIAGKVIPGPFEYCDIVTTTTHKTLRGPRAGVIFYRKSLEQEIERAVFPGLQGGPHNHTIAAIATAMHQATTLEFALYQRRVVRNAQLLAEGLVSRGYTVTTGGTDVHLILVDLRSVGLAGAPAERILELCRIACNKNTVPGDKSALRPSGIRLGTPAVTTRGVKECDIERIVDYIDRALKLAREIVRVSGGVLDLDSFNKTIDCSAEFKSQIESIRNDVESFSRSLDSNVDLC